jgi:hypothetical protein
MRSSKALRFTVSCRERSLLRRTSRVGARASGRPALGVIVLAEIAAETPGAPIA